MKLTPIFHHTVLPVRSGAYKTLAVDPDSGEPIAGEWGYSWFDATDRIWGCACDTPHEAGLNPEYEFAFQTKIWRGLVEEPKQ